jgi:hypothetical protein
LLAGLKITAFSAISQFMISREPFAAGFAR